MTYSTPAPACCCWSTRRRTDPRSGRFTCGRRPCFGRICPCRACGCEPAVVTAGTGGRAPRPVVGPSPRRTRSALRRRDVAPSNVAQIRDAGSFSVVVQRPMWCAPLTRHRAVTLGSGPGTTSPVLPASPRRHVTPSCHDRKTAVEAVRAAYRHSSSASEPRPSTLAREPAQRGCRVRHRGVTGPGWEHRQRCDELRRARRKVDYRDDERR